MDIKKSKELVISTISEVLKNKGEVSEDTHLIGEKSQLDSMNLVEICLILEDLADEHVLAILNKYLEARTFTTNSDRSMPNKYYEIKIETLRRGLIDRWRLMH